MLCFLMVRENIYPKECSGGRWHMLTSTWVFTEINTVASKCKPSLLHVIKANHVYKVEPDADGFVIKKSWQYILFFFLQT